MTTQRSPYRGLAPFGSSELDARLFFGRDREIEIVAANLQATRLTVLYGASGVGKSSLLRAGVVHRLREDGTTGAPRHVVAVCSAWSGDPLVAVGRAVADEVSAALDRPVEPTVGRPLVDELEDWCQALGGEIYLVLDQLEEYVLYHGAEDGGPLAEALAGVVSRRGLRVGVLLGVRDDALAELDGFKAKVPGLFGNLLRVDHLTREEGREAIVGPLSALRELGLGDVSVEDALVEDVLDQVSAGRIGATEGRGLLPEGQGPADRIEAPYLQLVLERVWDVETERGSSTLHATTLAELGGAAQIVEEHLERAMATLDDRGRELAAETFGFLVTPSGTKIAHRADDLARYAGVDPGELQPVLDLLAGERILRRVSDEHGAPPRYEIFHDVLAGAMLRWSDDFAAVRAVLAERRRRRRARAIVGAVVAGVVVIALTAAIALIERGRAGASSEEAASRRLDASSAAMLATDPELSLLLAGEAARRAPGPTTEDALRNALQASTLRAVLVLGQPVREVAFTPDARVVGAVGGDGLARVWDVATGRVLVQRQVGGDAGISFTRSGDVVVHGRSGPPVAVGRDGGVTCTFGKAAVADAAVAGDLVVLSNGEVYAARTCKRMLTIRGAGPPASSVIASGDGTRVALVAGPSATFVALPAGRVLSRVRDPSAIRELALDRDGARAVTVAASSADARVWETASGRLARSLVGHVGDVVAVAVDPPGKVAATGSTDGQARVWDMATGGVLTVLSGHLNFVDTVGLTPDAAYVLTASPDRTARTWTSTGRLVSVLAGHTGAVTWASFVGVGATVVTGSDDGTVRLWDAGTRPELVAAGGDVPPGPVLEVRSPNGSVTARADGDSIRLARKDGTEVVLEGHRAPVTSLALSPDGRRLVSASRDHDAIIWDVASGAALRVLRAHFGPVFDARYSPDGRWIVTAGPITAGLWDASNGAFVRYLRGAPTPLAAAAFTPDSRTVVTRSRDGTVSRYRCTICGTTPELLAQAEARLRETGRKLTAEERELYLG